MLHHESVHPDPQGQSDNRVITTDFYEAAYYLTLGCTVEDIELFTEFGKERIKMILAGDLVQSAQVEFFTSRATVNLLVFRRSYQRLMQTIQAAKRKIKETKRLQAQVKQNVAENEEVVS